MSECARARRGWSGAQIFALVFSPANIHFLGSSLTFMLVYVWSKRNRDVQMRLLEVLDFTAPYLPW